MALTLLGLFLLLFGLVSRRLQRSVVTAPMAFVAFGVLLGPGALGIAAIELEGEVTNLLAELTLVLVLFTDASRIDLKLLRRHYGIAIRLLVLGLPLTVLAGTAAALPLLSLDLWSAALLAAVLAPTDAALGQAVVSNPKVPVRVRQSLNVESGLNDGIALPAVLILLSLAVGEDQATGFWLRFLLAQLVLGPVVGVAVGFLGGRLLDGARNRGLIHPVFERLSSLALALLAFALAEALGGNGFIAAFSAGLTLGNSARAVCGPLLDFAEAEGQLLTLLMFLLFGSAMVWPALMVIGWPTLLYALLSLTVVRLLPVAASLLGMRLQLDTVLFLGWFGPRGIASILFGLLVLERHGLPLREEIFSVVVVTVLMSVFAHGVSAYPLSRWYGRRAEAMKAGVGMPELVETPEMPLRSRSVD